MNNKNKNKSLKEPIKELNENKVYIFLFLLSFILYSNTLFHGFVLDDEIVFTKNKYVQQGIDGIPTLATKGYSYGWNEINAGAYRPLPLIIFAIEKDLSGKSPFLPHLFNVLLYSACGVFLYKFLRKILHGYNYYLPLFISILFITHPLHTEAVANIKSGDEILCFFFLLITLLLNLRYFESNDIKYLFYSFLTFFMALLSKENAITFVAVIPLVIYFFYDSTFKEMIKISIPVIIASGIYLLLRFSFLEGTTGEVEEDVLNNTLLAANNVGERYATISKIMGKYLLLLVFPFQLSYDYSFNEITITDWSDFKAISSLIIHAGLLFLAIIKLRSRNIFSFCIFFYFITISLVTNIVVQIGATFAERFLFVPSLAFCIALSFGLYKILKIDFRTIELKPSSTLFIIIGIVGIVYSARSFTRNSDWKSNLTLFSKDVKSSPNSARTHYNLGLAYYESAGKKKNSSKQMEFYQKAISEYKKAVSIYPKFRDANTNLGFLLGATGNLDESISFLRKAIAIDSTNHQALSNMGNAWLHKSEPDSAIFYLKKSVSIKEDELALNNLGVAYGNKGVQYHQGNLRMAINYYKKGLSYNPNQNHLYENLSMAYTSLNMPDSAKYYSNMVKK